MDEQNLKKARSNIIVLIESLSQTADSHTADLVYKLLANLREIDEALAKR